MCRSTPADILIPIFYDTSTEFSFYSTDKWIHPQTVIQTDPTWQPCNLWSPGQCMLRARYGLRRPSLVLTAQAVCSFLFHSEQADRQRCNHHHNHASATSRVENEWQNHHCTSPSETAHYCSFTVHFTNRMHQKLLNFYTKVILHNLLTVNPEKIVCR